MEQYSHAYLCSDILLDKEIKSVDKTIWGVIRMWNEEIGDRPVVLTTQDLSKILGKSHATVTRSIHRLKKNDCLKTFYLEGRHYKYAHYKGRTLAGAEGNG